MDMRKKFEITGIWAPLLNRRGGVQMNVDRYEYVKMFSQSEPPPTTEGGLQMKVGRWDYTIFVLTNWAPPLQIPGSAPDHVSDIFW